MYDKNAGYNGRQQGEMKLRNPAPKAMNTFKSVISTTPEIDSFFFPYSFYQNIMIKDIELCEQFVSVFFQFITCPPNL